MGVVDPREYDRWCVSDLLRARQTAEPLIAAHGRRPTYHPELRERDVGEWEGVARATLRERGDWPRMLEWEGGPPGGEALADTARRILTWCAAQDAAHGILVIAHGMAIRAAVGVLDQMEPGAIARWKYGNAEILHREVAPGDWTAALERLADPSTA